ncbi:class I SAM-dependent methyltransferase [Agromyces laixinhei]|uniref:class I SAM-dependent methyltransferase n=1 Tax=Agromyces laixinhei TaxID=2585717 RepID=UPI001F3041FB|nr:class I SAM-dependent methyltransferase [Agromyces laixinhei]
MTRTVRDQRNTSSCSAGSTPRPKRIGPLCSHGRRFRIGQAEHLDVDDESLGGILAWYSLIHIDPALINSALTEFARGLRPGGGLALGFFEGPELASFDHAVTTAYYWPLELLSARIEACGFTVTGADRRTAPHARTHGFITAIRKPHSTNG